MSTSPWRRAGVFVTTAGDLDPGELARNCAAAGVRRVTFQLRDGVTARNVDELASKTWRRPLVDAGLTLGGWIQARTDPTAEAFYFAGDLGRFGLAYAIVAAEHEYKASTGDRDRSRMFAPAFAHTVGPAFPRMLSYLPNEAAGDDFDFRPWRNRLFRFAPQCDVPEFGAYVAPARAVELAEHAGPHVGRNYLHPTIYAGVPLFDTYAGELERVGVVGFDVWHAGRLEADEWAAIRRLVTVPLAEKP